VPSPSEPAPSFVGGSIDDPRDHTTQYELPALLFLALAATLCGARSCVDIADFAAANRADLAEIVDLPADATPSHDTFSRLFRLLDPEPLEAALRRFAAALRRGLGLGPAEGTVAVDGKRLRRGYERGRAHMPPLMAGIWDAETRLSLAARTGALYPAPIIPHGIYAWKRGRRRRFRALAVPRRRV